MAKNFNTEADGETTDVWLTPPSLLSKLGHFDVDPCAAVNRPWDCADTNYTILDDGLNQDWGQGRVWCNPPYGSKAEPFVDKLSRHTGMGLLLVFARTDTKWFQNHILNKARFVFFIKGRLKFHREDGSVSSTANAPSCLVAWDVREYPLLKKLESDGLGTLWQPAVRHADICATCRHVSIGDRTATCNCMLWDKETSSCGYCDDWE